MSPAPEWVALIIGAVVVARWGVIRALLVGGLILWWIASVQGFPLVNAALSPGVAFELAYKEAVEKLARNPGVLKLLVVVAAGWTLVLAGLAGLSLLAQVSGARSE